MRFLTQRGRMGALAPLVLVVMAGLLSTGCSSSSTTATPPHPASPPAIRTFTPRPTFTPMASAPTATPTVVPSLTPIGMAVPTVTGVPSGTVKVTAVDYLKNPPKRTPSPGRVVGSHVYPPGAYEFIHDQFKVPPPLGRVPDSFLDTLPAVGKGICPLSGLPVSDPAVLRRRPLAIRVGNAPAARLQFGLTSADMVIEALAEGGVTRFTALYLCQDASRIGPIRSARLIDLEITPMFDAVLVHVGASQPVLDMILSSPFGDNNIDDFLGHKGFHLDPNRRRPFSTFTNTRELWKVVESRGRQHPAKLRGLVFSDTVPPEPGKPATTISIPYRTGLSDVTYQYDEEAARYLRSQAGKPFTDAATGKQLAADNVVVVFSHVTVTKIVEDSLGSLSLHHDLGGQGKTLLFRNGQVWEGFWRREGENVMLHYVSADGNPLPLKPGQTWVQVVPDDLEVTWGP